MKTVIFICLLSLSVCLSAPQEKPAPAAAATEHALEQKDPNTPKPEDGGKINTVKTPLVPAQAVGTPAANNTDAANQNKSTEQTTDTNKATDTAGPSDNKTGISDKTGPITGKGTTEDKAGTTIDKASTTDKAVTTDKTGTTDHKAETTDKKTGTTDNNAGTIDHKDGPTDKKSETTDNKAVPTDNKVEPSKDSVVVPIPPNPAKPADTGKNTDKKPSTEIPPAVSTEHSKTTEANVVQGRSFDGPSFIGGIILTLGLLAVGIMGLKYYKTQTERNYHTL